MVLLLIGVFGQPDTEPGAGTTPSIGASTTPAPPPPPVAPPSPPSPSATPPATTTATPAPTPPAITVVVLNSIGESGLAGRVTDYLAELGYQTGTADDFATRLDTTTVYYPEGYEADARALAALAPGSGTAVAPVVPEVSADAITVVLGDDAAGWTPPTAPIESVEPVETTSS